MPTHGSRLPQARSLAWSRSRPELTALAVFLALYFSWLLLHWVPGDQQVLQIAFLAPVDALVVWSAWLASRRCEPGSWPRSFWLLVMGAWIAELVADLVLGVYDIALRDPTFPSLADLFYLCFYPLTLLALLRVPRAKGTRSQRLRIGLDCATIVVGGAVAVWCFVLGPILTGGAGATLATAVSAAYPIGDVVLLGAMATILIRRAPAAVSLPLRLVVVGLLMFIVADTLYGYGQLHGTYQPGSPVDVLYVLLAVPFVLAAASQRRIGSGDSGVKPLDPDETSLRASRLPLAATVLGFGILLATQWHDRFFPDLSLLFFALALAALTAARQYFAQGELLQLQGRVRTIVESVAEGIVTFGESGRIIWANAAADEVFGAAPGALVGQQVDVLFADRGWDEIAPRLGVGSGAGRGETVLGLRRELDGRRRDGGTFPLELVVTEALLDGERVFIGIGQDITERRRAERAKDEFLSVVGHELRTPLTSIRGSLGLLEGGVVGELPPEAERMLATAVTSTDRLVRLINDILDIERIDSDRDAIATTPVPASSLVAESVEVVAAVADQARVGIASEVDEVLVLADPDRIVQALINLLGNAIKYSPPHGTITVRVEARGEEALFSVHDHGRGIPSDSLESIFERFSQVDASDAREKGGTGLGLAIARTIVEHHGGRIWAESEPGRGATFRFTLPLVADRGRTAAPVADGARFLAAIA